MMVCEGGQSPSLPKGLTWHAAQHTNDGSRQHTCVPQAILFLQKLIPAKNCRRHAIYPTGVIQEGVKNLLLWKRLTQRKLATSMGVLKTTVYCWIVGSTICVHCNSLEPVLTEENKVARLLMALPFRDPVDLTKYHGMLDQIHLDEKWFCLTQKKERYLLLPEERKPKRCIKLKSHKAKTLHQTQIPHKNGNVSLCCCVP